MLSSDHWAEPYAAFLNRTREATSKLILYLTSSSHGKCVWPASRMRRRYSKPKLKLDSREPGRENHQVFQVL